MAEETIHYVILDDRQPVEPQQPLTGLDLVFYWLLAALIASTGATVACAALAVMLG